MTFIGASRDGYIRTFETRTGRELWAYKLPDRARSNPMTYLGRDGRQMVAIAAGRARPDGEDEIFVFALPRK